MRKRGWKLALLAGAMSAAILSGCSASSGSAATEAQTTEAETTETEMRQINRELDQIPIAGARYNAQQESLLEK